jgi:hypothetical protein
LKFEILDRIVFVSSWAMADDTHLLLQVCPEAGIADLSHTFKRDHLNPATVHLLNVISVPDTIL